MYMRKGCWQIFFPLNGNRVPQVSHLNIQSSTKVQKKLGWKETIKIRLGVITKWKKKKKEEEEEEEEDVDYE